MKDLFVLSADTDMGQVFRAILARPDALGIRPIKAVVDWHPWHDNGVFRDGPELIRRTIPKRHYQRFIVAFDHHGSGCNKPPEKCAGTIQERMNSFTFTDCSATIVISPELEEWLWRDPVAIGSVVGISQDEIAAIPGDPEERLRVIFQRHQRRPPRPRDFERIARRADLDAWAKSPSFHFLRTTLQNWFPAP